MTLRFRPDPFDDGPAGPPLTAPRRWRDPDAPRPDWAQDPERWRRILAACIARPVTLGDLHRAVRLPGEPNNLAKSRTLDLVRILRTRGLIRWIDLAYQTTGPGLTVLQDETAQLEGAG